MAKLAVKLRQQKRRKTVDKFKARRQMLLELLQSPRVSDEDKEASRGRPRGVFRKFGLGRTRLRELAMRGEVPGVIKASW